MMLHYTMYKCAVKGLFKIELFDEIDLETQQAVEMAATLESLEDRRRQTTLLTRQYMEQLKNLHNTIIIILIRNLCLPRCSF